MMAEPYFVPVIRVMDGNTVFVTDSKCVNFKIYLQALIRSSASCPAAPTRSYFEESGPWEDSAGAERWA